MTPEAQTPFRWPLDWIRAGAARFGDLSALLHSTGSAQEALWQTADEVRRLAAGDTVYLRALLEFSNRCVHDCEYCGLRRNNKTLERFALDPDTIVDTSLRAARAGYATIVLQSGDDPDYDRDTITGIIRRIKAGAPGLRVTLSVGERSFTDYRAWREAGADRYLLKHETADPQLFAALRPGTRLSARLKRAQWLMQLGYEVGMGNIVGLPGQTPAALEADLRLLAEYRPEMVGIGPFLPHPKTPLAGHPAGDPGLTLNFVATARLVLPQAMIPATTALATAMPGGREAALQAGANVVMVNVGSARSRALYEIYPSRSDGSGSWGPWAPAPDPEPSVSAQRKRVVAWLRRLGRVPDALETEGKPAQEPVRAPSLSGSNQRYHGDRQYPEGVTAGGQVRE